MEHTTETAITEREKELAEGIAKLGYAEQVFVYAIMQGLVNGVNPERMTMRQLHEYKRILGETGMCQIHEAYPLMRYILARYDDGGDMAFVLAMAYHAGIADGKRLDRQRRAHSAA